MSEKVDAQPQTERELVISRIIDAPPEKVFRCWTDAELLPKWFAPKPWSTPRAELDARSGGSNFIVMANPEGEEFPNRGVYLEVVPNERVVFTDAFTEAWVPSEKPFFVGIVTFEDAGDGRTLYTARARHWTEEDRAMHEKMGFHEGWGQCADQLEAVARSI